MSESQDWVEFGVTRDIHKKPVREAVPAFRKIERIKPELKALHKAFEAYIKETFTAMECFNEYTLDRSEYGSYTNMSVAMEYPQFKAGWVAARKFFRRGK
jgi:hypothetical protein